MDLVDSCKDKLSSLRIKELKGILTQLGISKQGKKQDLVERIISVLSDEQASKIWTKKKTAGREEIAKLVDDTFRKMQGCGTNDVESKGQDGSDGSYLKTNREVNDPSHSDRKVRCPCGSSLGTDSLIKCENKKCHVWQHIGCVIISEKPMEVTPPAPDSFYCELCRLSRADPFWVSVSHPLYPAKLTVTDVPTDSSNPLQSIERTFQITRADKDFLMKPEYDVQAWCMLLNDKVLFRMHWPQYTDLQVNGVPIRATNRPGQQLLGANGRDDGPIITPCTKEGINKISLTGCDTRVFCLGVRIVKRRTLQQVLKLIPKEAEGERLEDALARVCRCVGGGNEVDNADSDSDIEVVSEFVTVNLRCPMSGSRMKVAGRFKPCAHMGCFDLEVFVELNQRSRKWQCPICLKNYSMENIIVDPYFNRITSKMKDCSEDVAEVEVKSDGSWRVKCKAESDRRELQDLVEWHLPDGTLSFPLGEVNQTVQTSIQIKQEDLSERCTDLRLGMKKNSNGPWELGRPEDTKTPSSANDLHENVRYYGHNIIPMSSSATGSGRDEDPSVNQDGGGTFDLANNVVELDSTCLNIDSPFGFSDKTLCTPAGNADVIVLSDSDEENDILICPAPDYNQNQTDARIIMPLPSTSIADSYAGDPTFVNGGVTSALDLYNGNDEDFGMHLWQSPTGNHGGQGLQLFSTDADVSALVDLHQNSVSSVPSINNYVSGPGTTMLSANLVQDSLGQTDANIHDAYAVYPFPFDGDDPSLQIFLPTRPSDESEVSHARVQPNTPNGLRSDDWISLRLGDGADGSHDMPSIANDLGTPQQMPLGNVLYSSQQMSSDRLNISGEVPSNGFDTSEHAPSDGLNTTQQMSSVEASLLPGTDDSRTEKSSRQRSDRDSPFSFPRQKRSVRPRLYLSIDSGSE